RQIQQRFLQYGQGVPGSSPDEQAALASQQAALGEQQLNQRNQLYAALGANQGTGNAPDMIGNLGSLFTAQHMAVDQQHLLNALAQRREALLQAANVGQGISSMAG